MVPFAHGTADGGFGPGVLGKMPAVGDFVRSGLPRALAERWDALLTDAVELCRRRHGRDWATLPPVPTVWRFACAAGVAGADAVAGALLPSTDRVGRAFPLLVAASLPAGCGPAIVPFACDTWFVLLDAALLAARAGSLDHASFIARLEGLGRPAPEPGFTEPACRRIVEDRTGPLPANATLLWTLGSQPDRSAFVACAGLPGAAALAALFDDGWLSWTAVRGGNP